MKKKKKKEAIETFWELHYLGQIAWNVLEESNSSRSSTNSVQGTGQLYSLLYT